MKKKTNELISNWFLPILGIGMLISGFVFYDKLTFVPELTFCSSNPTETLLKIFQKLCEVPILRRIVLILNTRLIVLLCIYAVIFASIYFILTRMGFKESEVDEHIETKEEKKKWEKYQINIFLITIVVIFLLLIFFN